MPDMIFTQFARDLRQKSTEAETVLWEKLRNRRCEKFKFRRQHAIDDFILDFYCPAVRLAIEVDGRGHAEKQQADYDRYRTEALRYHGIRVIRFWNHEVLKQLDGVVTEIRRVARFSAEHPL